MDGDVIYQVGGPGVTWREVGDEIVVLDLKGSVYFGLNATAVTLWRRLVDGATPSELSAALAADARIDAERAGRDVDAFLASLRAEGLLQPA